MITILPLKKCLVIGGGGYIGSHLVPILIKKGRTVTVIGRQPIPTYQINCDAKYIQASFSKLDTLQSLLDEHEEVIHLAHDTTPNARHNKPIDDLLNNLLPNIQLFSEASIRGNRLVIVSSGGTVYGEALALPITEMHPTQPISSYGVTKHTVEQYAFLYAATHGLKVICVRPSNAYGEGQRPFMGQGFIATAIASGLLDKPITIFGDKNIIRDYIYITDLANAISLALDQGEPGNIYNIGSGVGLSTFDILDVITPLANSKGHNLKIIRKDARPFDVRKNVLDSTKLRDLTGWKSVIDFQTGIKQTFDWLAHNI